MIPEVALSVIPGGKEPDDKEKRKRFAAADAQALPVADTHLRGRKISRNDERGSGMGSRDKELLELAELAGVQALKGRQKRTLMRPNKGRERLRFAC